MGTAVIPGRDTSPVLQPAECVFNKMSLLIQRVVKGKCFFPVFRGGMQTVIPLAFSDSRNHVAS